MTKKTTLATLINDNAELTGAQKKSLFELLSKRCRKDTKIDLSRKINDVPLSLWSNYGILGRLHVEQDGTFSYCAGQDYVGEIATVRKCILGK